MAAPRHGKLELIYGPMFSEKTSELIRWGNRLEHAKKRCLYVKPCIDTRYSDNCVATHDGHQKEAMTVETLGAIPDRVWKTYDAIAIDEIQFFDDAVSFTVKAINAGLLVFGCGCDGTSKRKPFGRVLELIPHAHSVRKLNAVCFDCYDDAPYTVRMSDNASIEDETDVVIGGADCYKSLCLTCYNRFYGIE